MNNWVVYSATVFLLSISLTVKSSDDEFEISSLGAHAHGEAHLTLATQANQLLIEFESPALNLFGFEHKANTESEINVVKQSKSILESVDKLFSYQGSDCTLVNSDIHISGLEETHHDHHEHEHHDESHRDVLARYQFNCVNGAKLISISTALFSQFSGIEKINVRWVTETKQGAAILRAEQNSILLK